MGEIDDISESKSVVFVTVGTTSFDALVRAVDSQEVRETLFRKGYTHLVIQMGRGSYIPSKVLANRHMVFELSFFASNSVLRAMKQCVVGRIHENELWNNVYIISALSLHYCKVITSRRQNTFEPVCL